MCSTCAVWAPSPHCRCAVCVARCSGCTSPGVPLHRPVRLLHPRHSIYMVPRPGDVIVVGASEIESEDRSPVSLRSTLELLSAAHSVIPALAEARVVHT